MRELLRAGLHQHGAVFLRAAISPGLKQILERDPYLPLHTTNRLLKHFGEERARFVNSNRVLQVSPIVKKHRVIYLLALLDSL